VEYIGVELQDGKKRIHLMTPASFSTNTPRVLCGKSAIYDGYIRTLVPTHVVTPICRECKQHRCSIESVYGKGGDV